jgi:hypothetical protein
VNRPEMSDADAAAALARQAYRFAPRPEQDAVTPDLPLAQLYATLAVYHQTRALTQETIISSDPHAQLAQAVNANSNLLDMTASGVGATVRELGELTIAAQQLTFAVEQLRASPLRRLGDRIDRWWARVRFNSMPHPPIQSFVRTPAEPRPTWHPVPMEAVDRLTGTDFEHRVASLLERAGWQQVTVVGGAGDMGVDLTATSECGTENFTQADGARGVDQNSAGQDEAQQDEPGQPSVELAVQCKRYGPRRRITSGEMRGFIGGAHACYRARKMLFVTTTTLTPGAQTTAEQAGVAVVDRESLAAWLHSGTAPDNTIPNRSSNSTEPPDDLDDLTQPSPPPPPPRKPLYSTTVLILVSAVVLTLAHLYDHANILIGGQAITPRVPSLMIAIIAFGVIGLMRLRYWWRLYWWRVGVRENWIGWHVISLFGRLAVVRDPASGIQENSALHGTM